MRRSVSILLMLLTASCSSQAPEADADRTWVGTITSEGDITTVVNESGSVWGGTARLVEETSIGVESGAEEFMFGEIASLYAKSDRIAVLDRQAQVVRVYDQMGAFVRSIGGPGSGPGEFQRAVAVTMDDDGNVYVLDAGSRRVSRFAPEGVFGTSWQVPAFWCCGGTWFPAPEGRVWISLEEREVGTGRNRFGVQAYGPEGPYGNVLWEPETDFLPPSFETPERTLARLPFAPRLVRAATATGGIAAGPNDHYSFEIVGGSRTSTVVEHYADPAPVGQDEWEWNRRLVVAVQNRGIPGWTWDGAELPRYQPAFSALAPAVSGEIWVRRPTGSRRLEECTENPLDAFTDGASGPLRPCYAAEFAVDVFRSDGLYLGEVEVPSGFDFSRLHVDADSVVAATTDEAGTLFVKRFRLVLPGEQ